jgi:hypothetical protein
MGKKMKKGLTNAYPMLYSDRQIRERSKIMRHGNLTREQAIEIAGQEAVDAVERENCEPTSRCQTDGDTAVEFAASITCTHRDGAPATLTAYYYQTPEALATCDGDDYSRLDWEINGWEVQ